MTNEKMMEIMKEKNLTMREIFWMTENGYDPEKDDFYEAVGYNSEVYRYDQAYEICDEYNYDPVDLFKEFVSEYGMRPGDDDFDRCGICEAAAWLLERKTIEKLEDDYDDYELKISRGNSQVTVYASMSAWDGKNWIPFGCECGFYIEADDLGYDDDDDDDYSDWDERLFEYLVDHYRNITGLKIEDYKVIDNR